jgi:hypothetical protein
MALTSSNFSRGKLLVATVFALGMLTTASQAYTLEQEQMCSGDAMRLCASEIPNVARITACMESRRDELSEGCRAVFETDTPAATAESPVTEAPAARPSKPINLVPSTGTTRYRHG